MTRTADDPQRRIAYQRRAIILTIWSLLATLILVVSNVLAPKSGPEALIVLIPWALALVIHGVLTIPAVLYVARSRSHILLGWIYAYFLAFWVVCGWLYLHDTGADLAIMRKVDTIKRPQESRLVALIEKMERDVLGDHPIDPAALASVTTLIENGADVAYRTPGGRQPLINAAAAIGDPDLIRLMVAKGANVEGDETVWSSPLMRAVQQNNPAAVSVLLVLGADPNHQRYNPETPLTLAIRRGNHEVVSALLTAGAAPDHAPATQLPALMIAAGQKDVAAMELLLAAGADPNRTTRHEASAMTRAIDSGCTACVERLLESGGRAIGKIRKTGALALAMKKEMDNVVALFAKRQKAADNPAGFYGDETYEDLFAFIHREDWAAVQTFLAAGVPPDLRNPKNQTVLLRIASRNYWEGKLSPAAELKAAQMLIAAGADPDAVDGQGRTALFLAAGAGATDMAHWLIEHGADVNVTDRANKTALHQAIWKGHVKLSLALIDAGADVNATTGKQERKETVLDHAVRAGLARVVERLLEGGATLDLTGSVGANTLRLIVENSAVLQAFIQHGLELDRRDRFGRYPLAYAMQPDRLGAFEQMVRAGATPYFDNWRGVQPLIYCARDGHAHLVRLCMEKSPRVRQDQDYQRKALYVAIRNGRVDVVRVILENGQGLDQDPSYIDGVKRSLKQARAPEEDPGALSELQTMFADIVGKEEKSTAAPRRKGSPEMMVLPPSP